jgi:hypothetical protein
MFDLDRIQGDQFGEYDIVSSSNLIGREALLFAGDSAGSNRASKVSP